MQQLLTTQAYVESLGEEELVALMARLEMKEDELRNKCCCTICHIP